MSDDDKKQTKCAPVLPWLLMHPSVAHDLIKPAFHEMSPIFPSNQLLLHSEAMPNNNASTDAAKLYFSFVLSFLVNISSILWDMQWS